MTNLQLLRAIRAVCEQARPEAPGQVSQSEFDRSRAAAGYPELKQAKHIAAHFKISWVDLREFALDDPNLAWRRIRREQSDRRNTGLSLDMIVQALKQVARSLGRPTINRSEYAEERTRILARTRNTHAREAADWSLPTLKQIDNEIKRRGVAWNDLLQRAGLEPYQGPARGMPVGEAVRHFAEQTGGLPRSRKYLDRWAMAREVRLGHYDTKKMRAAIAELQAERAAAGLAPLADAPRDAEAGDPSMRPPGAPRGAPKQRWSRETLIRGLALAISELDGEHPTVEALRPITRGRATEGIPGPSTVRDFIKREYPDETWEQWLSEAEELAAELDE